MEKKIKVLIVEPEREPRAAEIDNTLKAMQEIVGGYIETITLGGGGVLVCNEDGKLLGLPENRPLANDVIRGTFFIADTDGDEFASLDGVKLRYFERFFQP